MKRIFIFIFWGVFTCTASSQVIQNFSYEGLIFSNGKPLKKKAIGIRLSIIPGAVSGAANYSEHHKTDTDSAGKYQLAIGAGEIIAGKFDSIIWSEGIYYLHTEIDTSGDGNYSIVKNSLMRMPPDLNNDYEQGTITSTEYPDHGVWHFKNNRHARPRLVNIDLTTSYSNLAYPANTYPIYRHYEWSDLDRDGVGNSFCISYSENTQNAFIENTTMLGEVKLYPKPFQELTINSTDSEITISISKPVPQTNHSETYAIKGPWKFIYYFEW